MRPIVIIDDDADVRDVMTFALENEGYSVIQFENGRVALEELEHFSSSKLPCFIIVDYLMPHVDGVTFIKEVQSRFPDTLGRIPMALTSAMDSLEPAIDKAENLYHIHKPMDLEDLLKLIRRHCQTK